MPVRWVPRGRSRPRIGQYCLRRGKPPLFRRPSRARAIYGSDILSLKLGLRSLHSSVPRLDRIPHGNPRITGMKRGYRITPVTPSGISFGTCYREGHCTLRFFGAEGGEEAVKSASPDMPRLPSTSCDLTRKWCSPDAKFTKATLCEVTLGVESVLTVP